VGLKTWSIPCGSTYTNITCPIQTFQCPVSCVYWNSSLSAWKSDGCLSEIVGSTVLCHCTHMTDFSTRIEGVISENQKVFAIAGSVYSKDGLALYATWYQIFGSLALCSILIIVLTTWLDFPLRKIYVDLLMKHKKFKLLLNRAPLTPVYRYNGYSSLTYYKELSTKQKPIKHVFNPCKRMCLQHSYLQALLRFDPRLSRSFRTLFLMLMQFHSLFVTAFLYGFSFGTKKDLSIADTVLLSIITSLVTIPCVRIALYSLNTVGLKEFEYQFPMLHHEYLRRVEFETIAKPLFEGKGAVGAEAAGAAEGAGADAGDTEDQAEQGVYSTLFSCIGSMCKKEEEEVIVNRSVALKDLAACVKKEYPKFKTYSILWELLPCHTFHGWAFLLLSFGWIGWCLQYLLLFAASHPSSVGDSILISYATSEIVTICVSQPLTILLSIAFFVMSHKYKAPWPFSLISSVSTKHAIPSMYYFSNPLNNRTFTVLTSEFAYLLFLDIPSEAAGIDIFSTAPIKSILTTIHGEEEVPDTRIQDLYYSMVQYYTDQQK